MRTADRSMLAAVLMLVISCALRAQTSEPRSVPDSDADGLSDAVEQALLVQFAPQFQVSTRDCSNVPAEFLRDTLFPTVRTENGTIYGQAFPAAGSTADAPMVELHFYHLWRSDCGSHGHALDTEHVSVLVRRSGAELGLAAWRAVYWYAAAHENTVCDVSQIARASTLHAEEHGPKVWISPGKHASYLNERLCQRGCGADRCDDMRPLEAAAVINLGEPQRPMNGSAFTASRQWPLQEKMQATNFPPEPLARLNGLPATEIAWFHAGRHPAQQVIAISGATEASLAEDGRSTRSAVATGQRSTSTAISVASDATGGALGTSYRRTRNALGSSARKVGHALGIPSSGSDSGAEGSPKSDATREP